MRAPSTFAVADAAGYEIQMGRWSRRLAIEFTAFVELGDGERILDVGCGTGSLASVIVSVTTTSTIDGVDLAAGPAARTARSFAVHPVRRKDPSRSQAPLQGWRCLRFAIRKLLIRPSALPPCSAFRATTA